MNQIINQPQTPPSQYDLLKAIRGKKQGDIKGEKSLYHSNFAKRDIKARQWIAENLEMGNKTQIFPGQMLIFDYAQPKLEEQLEYYDAGPCTIFFGLFQSQEGPRVIGWNLHYYPTRVRFRMIGRLFELFKKDYLKAWNEPLTHQLTGFDYKRIIRLLKSANLDFGIREYIPELMHNITPIPPSAFQKAVYTEGRFMKETRENIMRYWRSRVDATITRIK